MKILLFLNVVEHASKFSQNFQISADCFTLASVMAELLTILWFFTI